MTMPVSGGVRMMPVDASLFESVGYMNATRKLYIKFRSTPMMCYDNVPGFRYQGLMAAPRKDAYFNSYIKNQFLAKEAPPPGM